MNHLAHALLSGPDPDWVLGGMLGDFVHGGVPATLRPGVQAGLRLHRAIDVYTDAHPRVVALRAEFSPPLRRYAGIVVDVWFDHLLARDFADWSRTPLTEFSRALRTLLRRHAAELPVELQRFAAYMERAHLPQAYRDPATLAQVFAGLSARLRRANPLAGALQETRRLEAPLAAAFAAFFPDLRAYAEAWRAQHAAPETRTPPEGGVAAAEGGAGFT
jgi:acyl carrier protein phosphodiesterase